MRVRHFAFFILISVLCTACGPKYSILVDAINSHQFESCNYKKGSYLITTTKEKNKNNLYYEEFYASVKKVFEKNGNVVVDDPKLANFIAFIDFNTSEPHEYTVTETVPITGQVGVDTHTTYSYGPYGYVSQNTYTTPRYGTVGYNTYQRKEILYTHSISVVAYDFLPFGNENKKAWQVIAVDSSSSSDFRNHLEPLLITLEKYMTKNTKGSIYAELYEENGKLIIKNEKSSKKKFD